jgi:hypothetical protein
MKRAAAFVIILILGGVAAFLLRPTGDGCELLDEKLGTESRSPAKLLEVIGWQYDRDQSKNPYGLVHPEFFDVQHQALVRLLALQADEFGIDVPEQITNTLRVDHSGAMLVKSDSTGVVINGSSSTKPDEFDGPHSDPYYRWERFEFDSSGRFQRRAPIKQ